MTILNCKIKNMYVINFCDFVVTFGKVDDKFSIKFRKKKSIIFKNLYFYQRLI